MFTKAKEYIKTANRRMALQELESLGKDCSNEPTYHLLKADAQQGLGYYQDALVSWNKLRDIEPSNIRAIVEVARCYYELEMAGEAEKILNAHLTKHPDDKHGLFVLTLVQLKLYGPEKVFDTLANSPVKLSDHRAEQLRKKLYSFLSHDDLLSLDKNLLLMLKGIDGAQSVYDAFESIGHNCEFGSVQRLNGADSLGLLRWTGVLIDDLIDLIESEFKWYSDPQIYRLDMYPDSEYKLVESRYRTNSHTNLRPSEIDADTLLDKLVKRQRFLIRKFIEDASSGRKIYVYQSPFLADISKIDRLQSALERLGANKFLFVFQSDGNNSGGTVSRRDNKTVIGHLSSFMHNTGKINNEEWDSIVSTAYKNFMTGD